MTNYIATAELHARTILDPKAVEVNRPDMWSRGSHAIVGSSPRYAVPATTGALLTPPRPSWWVRVRHLIANVLRTAATEYRVRDEAYKLRSLDDRTLADMGLLRSEIEHAVRNGHPRWQRPAPRPGSR